MQQHGHAGTPNQGSPVVDLADATAEHDWLDPFPALAVGQALAECAAVAGDQGLAELVAVVTGAVGGVDQNLERRGQVLCGRRNLKGRKVRAGSDPHVCEGTACAHALQAITFRWCSAGILR